MPYAFGDPLGYFNVGQQAGMAAKTPFETGAGNVMDVFKANIENQMKLAQTAALFKAEKEYDYSNDPTKVIAGKNLAAMSDSNTGASVGGGSNGAATPGKVSGGTASGGPQTGTAGNMIQQSAEGFGGKKFINPAVGAEEQQYKDALASNQKFASANSMISNIMRPMAAAHKEVGGGGMLPGMVGGVAKSIGSLPNTSAIGAFNTATKDFQTNQAMQFTGNAGGISKLVSYFGHDSSPSLSQSPENNIALLAQQRINDLSLHLAHSASPYSKIPFEKLDDDKIQEIIDAAKNPNMVTPRMREIVINQTKAEFAQAQREVEMEGTEQMNPLSQAVSGMSSAIPYSGFGSQKPAAWNELKEAQTLQKLVAANPDKKEALMQRFNQRKKEAQNV